MARPKNTGSMPMPRPGDNWIVGMMIGAAIMTMAMQAIMLGASVAIRDTTKRG